MKLTIFFGLLAIALVVIQPTSKVNLNTCFGQLSGSWGLSYIVYTLLGSLGVDLSIVFSLLSGLLTTLLGGIVIDVAHLKTYLLSNCGCNQANPVITYSQCAKLIVQYCQTYWYHGLSTTKIFSELLLYTDINQYIHTIFFYVKPSWKFLKTNRLKMYYFSVKNINKCILFLMKLKIFQ